ncbi:MAG: hypothetical protein KGL39_58340 [Patescibacteria group bacterium]|nr:hypothetical protein [Patescibacteria group bacterium]
MEPETEDRVNFFLKVVEQDRQSGGHIFGRWEVCPMCNGVGGGDVPYGNGHDGWEDCPTCQGVGKVDATKSAAASEAKNDERSEA